MGKSSFKIACYGGSFDPVHNGHLTIAQDVWEQFKPASLLWIPTFLSPLKKNIPTPAKHRLALLKQALKPYPHFKILDTELKAQGLSYTYNTIQHLKVEFPKAKFYWIIGLDQVAQLSKWYEFEKLCQEIEFIAVSRPALKLVSSASTFTIPPQAPPQARIHWVKNHLMQISSSEIRYRIGQKLPIQPFIPESVYKYIAKYNLYTS